MTTGKQKKMYRVTYETDGLQNYNKVTCKLNYTPHTQSEPKCLRYENKYNSFL